MLRASSISVATGRCTWNAGARVRRLSCSSLASRVQPRIGRSPTINRIRRSSARANFARACAYDRPGTPVGEKPSRSDPVPQPTTAGDAVADLHALLIAAREAGPCVLVGHSYGGLVARLYASTYPEDVSGLVLVDALSEGLRDAETPEQWTMQRKLMEGEIRESLALYPALERIDPDRSFDPVRAAQPRLR
jgi:pimeloyl-ACP methyl ester carboxylesterase